MSGRGRRRAWAELLRVSAVFTVPGDALAGAAAAGVRPGARTGLAVGASVCLYEAGMALNDWADREEDAAERPERPIPSGRIRPGAALAAAGGLTAAGLVLAACAGRRAAAVAGALAGTVWAYDLGLKHTKAGPAAMAAARSLDLLLGAAAASPGGIRPALPSALALGGHTYAVTAVSRRETQGGAPLTSLAALAGTALLAVATTRPTTGRAWTGLGLAGLAALPEPGVLSAPAGPGAASALAGPNLNLPRLADAVIGLPALPEPGPSGPRPAETAGRVRALAEAGLAGAWRLTGPGRGPAALAGLAALYAGTVGWPLVHAVLNPSPPLTQKAVGGGIRAMIPLQAALAARAGAPGTALALAGLVPVARRLSRKVNPT
ncbi:SCO3242 family prenyltransferase [Streptomyces sp. NPDC051211]|uniref:SCO3242 family prenyltransferase n=1 Tax=Streptomyces sp. NPDC051211 TaxID=3154643 RepID=UPI00344C4684